MALPEQVRSLWLDTAPAPPRPKLERNRRVDAAVLGAGIVGLTTALMLRREGLDVAVLEARSIGRGTTSYSTAKVSSLHGLIYQRLISSFGEDGARAYAEANEAGLARVAGLVEELGIDCDFRRRPNLTYTESPEERRRIEDEVVAATKAGLQAEYVEDCDLPFEIAAAIRVGDQAEFHPQRYLLGLASALEAEGGAIFEGTRALAVDGGEPCRVRTARGAEVTADHVVVATHMPFLDRGLYFARVHPERSYALAVRARQRLAAMYLSTEQPSHSIRAAPVDGGELVLIGGESHKAGQSDAAERYRSLEDYARRRFEVESVEYRWATQDNMPVDGMPFVGRLWPFSDRLWTATGFHKWGLAAGTAAAGMLTDAISGRPNPWPSAFDSTRIGPPGALKDLLKENANAGLRFAADRVRQRGSARDLQAGEGRVVGRGLAQRAVYRDERGRLQSLSARCTHLGCIVNWNSAERVWDCPCHGSRFAADGSVIEGPATSRLPPAEG